MRVELSQASVSDEPVLANLLNLYLHDFSEAFGDSPGPDGRFVYERLPLYFTEAGRTPFLIQADGRLAGFALVTRGSRIDASPLVWDLTEFFVTRGLRRRGIGQIAASELFARFPGTWEVRALDRNKGAFEFWDHAVSRHTTGNFAVAPWESSNGMTWKVFRFSQHSNTA
jgi:predicted acetyltransferase